MKELCTRFQVLLTDSGLPENLWAEAMSYGNWLRNRLPKHISDGNLNLVLEASYSSQGKEFAVLRPTGVCTSLLIGLCSIQALLAQSVHSIFVDMYSDERLCRVYEPTEKGIFIVRCRDFKLCREEKLPNISTLLDEMGQQ